MSGPTTARERIESIDVLRGFALLGILLINMQTFALPAAAYLNPTAYGDLTGANFWAWAVPHVLADFKFISIFSILFGAGIVLMAQREEARGTSAAGLHYRRMGWMILFGILHAHLLWFGDILYSYGMTGLVVYFLRSLRPRVLLVLALILGLIPSVLLILIGLTIPFWPSEAVQSFDEEGWNPSQETLQEELTAYRGSYLQQMLPRSLASFAGQLVAFPILTFWRVASLMLIGMALFKVGALSAKWSRGRYLGFVALGIFVGVPVITFGVYRNFQQNWDLGTFFFGFQYNYWGSYFVALGWIGMIMLWCRSTFLAALRSRLAALGRMAFSNYILQTLICTTIFYGHGFGYFGSVERKYLVLLALLIYALQVAISPLWLRYYTLGPLEALWRRLTYGRRQAIAE